MTLAATIAATCAAVSGAQSSIIITNVHDPVAIGNGFRIGQGSVYNSAAFQFRMGNDAYVLTELEIRGSFTLCSGNVAPLFTIRADNIGSPGVVLATFTPPAVLGGPAFYTLTTSAGTVLDADTTYWLDGRPAPGATCFGWGGTVPSVMPTGVATGIRYTVNSGVSAPGQAMLRLELRGDLAGPFSNYCSPAVANSTGVSVSISALGSASVVQNNMVLHVTDLPLGSFAFFLVGANQDFVMNAGGSAGTLCLGVPIGRYVGPGQIQNAGTTGTITLPVDWTQVPQPNGGVVASAGQTWNFQAWYRDVNLGFTTSNFSDGLSVVLQ